MFGFLFTEVWKIMFGETTSTIFAIQPPFIDGIKNLAVFFANGRTIPIFETQRYLR